MNKSPPKTHLRNLGRRKQHNSTKTGHHGNPKEDENRRLDAEDEAGEDEDAEDGDNHDGADRKKIAKTKTKTTTATGEQTQPPHHQYLRST